jgi:hypothetical protein
MSKYIESRLEDDVSDEAVSKGVTIHDQKMLDLEKEKAIQRRLNHSIWREWSIVIPVLLLTYCAVQGNDGPRGIMAVLGAILLADTIDRVGTIRTKALLDWIEYQKSKDKPQG